MNIVTEEEVSLRMVCAHCDKPFVLGMEYAEIPQGFLANDLCVLLVCVPCSLGAA